MDEYAEIYFLDDYYDDMRNAPRDHRVGSPLRPGSAGMIRQPAGRPAARPATAGRAVVVRQPTGATSGRVMVTQHEQPRMPGLAGLTPGDWISMLSQAFAAMQPLPGAPTASGHVDSDVSNLITYQSALALHAKRDEQLRTIGSLVSKLLG
jgi:hypothetical protein